MQEKVPAGLFPVKAKIPVAMAVHLSLAFPFFELIDSDDPEWWTVPESYERKSMKEQLEKMGDRVEQLMIDDMEREADERASGAAASAADTRGSTTNARNDAPTAPSDVGHS